MSFLLKLNPQLSSIVRMFGQIVLLESIIFDRGPHLVRSEIRICDKEGLLLIDLIKLLLYLLQKSLLVLIIGKYWDILILFSLKLNNPSPFVFLFFGTRFFSLFLRRR